MKQTAMSPEVQERLDACATRINEAYIASKKFRAQERAARRAVNKILRNSDSALRGQVVYFLRAEVADGPIKIGYSTDLPSRLGNMETVSPFRLTVLATINGGTRRDEARIHQRFAAARLHGEWFEPVDDLLEFIDELQQQENIA